MAEFVSDIIFSGLDERKVLPGASLAAIRICLLIGSKIKVVKLSETHSPKVPRRPRIWSCRKHVYALQRAERMSTFRPLLFHPNSYRPGGRSRVAVLKFRKEQFNLNIQVTV